jgi:leucyl aminopeptidase
MWRRFFSTTTSGSSIKAAHKLVEQKVQGKVSLLDISKASTALKTRVCFVPQINKKAPSPQEIQALLPFQVSNHALKDFKAQPQEKILLYPTSEDEKYENHRLLLVGLGESDKIDEDTIRKATHSAVSALKSKKLKDAVLEVPTLDQTKLETSRIVELFTQVNGINGVRVYL